MFAVLDRTFHVVCYAKTRKEAEIYREIKGRYDWQIVEHADYRATSKQQSAVRFCERILNIKFTGNINSGKQCSDFLSDYLEIAKQHF